MISYKLAKQLKDAGWEQFLTLFHYHPFDKKECDTPWDCDYEPRVDIPTLSELIEACGDEWPFILCKDRYSGTYSGGIWNCIIDTEPYDCRWEGGDGESAEFWQEVEMGKYLASSGKSPEEAVAKLWLKLHQK